MKINEKELRKMVREVVRKNIMTLKEGEDFTARRQIVQSAKKAAMDFENEIINLLGLVVPDDMPPNLQKQYYVVVQQMSESIVTAVQDATRELAKFPKAKNE